MSSTLFTGTGLSVGLTQHQRIVLAAPFDAVRIWIPNMHTSAVAGVTAMVGVSSALGAWSGAAPSVNNTGAATAASPTPSETVSSLAGALAVYRPLTFAGAASATLPAAVDATNLVPSYTPSEWCPVASVGNQSILDVRMFWPVAGGFVPLAFTGVSNSAWAMWGRDDILTGGRAWRCWNQDVDGVTTPANFTATTTTPTLIPIIVEYRSQVAGQTIATIGDSTFVASAGSTYPGNSMIWGAILAASSPGMPIEHCSLDAPGAASTQHVRRANLMVPQLRPSILLAQPASINNFGTSLGQRVQQEGLGAAGVLRGLAEDVDASLILTSMLPVTAAARAWGATDSQRTALNASLAGLAKTARLASGSIDFLDFGPAYDGASNGGQIEPIPALVHTDGFHFGDPGNSTLLAPTLNSINRVIAAQL